MRLLTLIGVGMALLPMGRAQERPVEWLQRAVRAEQTLVVSGERVTEIRRGAHIERIVERFWRQDGRTVRIEVIAPPARSGEILLLRGEKWVLYRPGAKEAVPLHAPLHQHEMVLKRLLSAVQRQAMRIELRPPESVLNRPCVVLFLQMTEPSEPMRPDAPPPFERGRRRHEPIQSITLWIDRATGLVLRREVQFRHRDARLRMEITRVEFPQKLPLELFQLPEGVTVRPPKEGHFESPEEAQKVAGFPLRLPNYLPEGTQRESIFVRRIRERALVAIRYRCPQGDFTLFQMRAPNADFRLHMLPKHRPLNAHFWQAGDYWFGLVGTLPKDEMERIARSIPQ
ncbi:MAG: hypothetical protein ABDI19_07495 [Armatimonadota bacterium]